jgi:hypothetical protein
MPLRVFHPSPRKSFLTFLSGLVCGRAKDDESGGLWLEGRDQQKAATLQKSGGFCRFVRRSEHLTGNFYLLLTRYLCRRFAYFKLRAHLLKTSGKSVNLLLLLRGSRV